MHIRPQRARKRGEDGNRKKKNKFSPSEKAFILPPYPERSEVVLFVLSPFIFCFSAGVFVAVCNFPCYGLEKVTSMLTPDVNIELWSWFFSSHLMRIVANSNVIGLIIEWKLGCSEVISTYPSVSVAALCR